MFDKIIVTGLALVVISSFVALYFETKDLSLEYLQGVQTIDE